MKIRLVGAEFVQCGQTDRQRDRYDKANSRFSKFCKRTQKWRGRHRAEGTSVDGLGSVAHYVQLDDETKEETFIARISLELVHVRQPRISVVQY